MERPTHVIVADDEIIPVLLKNNMFYDIELLNLMGSFGQFLMPTWEWTGGSFCQNIHTDEVLFFSNYDSENDLHVKTIGLNKLAKAA